MAKPTVRICKARIQSLTKMTHYSLRAVADFRFVNNSL